jgi:hypothetical protein
MRSCAAKGIGTTTLAICLLTPLGPDSAWAQGQCASGQYTYTFTNFCPFPVWVGQTAAASNEHSYPPQNGNWALAARCTANAACVSGTCDQGSGQCTCSTSSDCSGTATCLADGKCSTAATFCMPQTWDSGTFWPRTGCTAVGTTGLNCSTGQCTPAGATTGLLDCGVGLTSPTNPVTQFEVTSTSANANYDVSIVAGANVETNVTPVGGSYLLPGVPAGENAIACYSAGCSTDLNSTCPTNLQVKLGNTVVGCLDTCTQCQRTSPTGSTPNAQIYSALKCDKTITADFSKNTPATTTTCTGTSGGLPTYQDLYCVQNFGEKIGNAQASSNQGTDTAFSQADCFPDKTFIIPTFSPAYIPPAGAGVCLYASPPQSDIPGFNDYGWFDFAAQKALNCRDFVDGTACGGYLTGHLDKLPDGTEKYATYPSALGYSCQTVAYQDLQSRSQTAHLCLPSTTSGLGLCTFDSLGQQALYTGVGGVFNAAWLQAGVQAGKGSIPYYQTFKAACGAAYTWQYDDASSGFGCNPAAVPNGGEVFSGFNITLCGSLASTGVGGLPPVTGIPFTGSGTAERVGAGRNGRVEVSGRFWLPVPTQLDLTTLTLTDLLNEVGGAGELTERNHAVAGVREGGDRYLPITLHAHKGSNATGALYQTLPWERPSVKVEIENRDPISGLMEFSVVADDVSIDKPTECRGADEPTTQLATSFDLKFGSRQVNVGAVLPWQCLGKELRTP